MEYIQVDDKYNPTMQLPDPSLVDYYENLKSRTYWIISEIDDSYLDLVSKIIKWNRDDCGIPVAERRPIKIFISSPGGSLDVEETLTNFIKISKTPVYAYGIGPVASAAAMIYLSCHKRFATKNCYWVLHHGGCSEVSGTYEQVQASMKNYAEQIKKMEDFCKENTDYPTEIIEEKLKGDWYIHMDEALEHGIVNEIINDIDEAILCYEE